MLLLRVLVGLLLAAVPSRLRIVLYRLLFGYQIGKGVKIGFGVMFLQVARCRIGDHVHIGPFNLFYRVGQLHVGDHARMGWLNVVRGGQTAQIGPYATILRCNVFNSILQADAVNPRSAVLELGTGVVITTGHWLDFSDRITIGPHTVVGGRNSSFWTHNRQRTRPIAVGSHCYLGSEIRVAPGVEIADSCVIALGAVLMGSYGPPRSLIAGNPASVLRPLNEHDLFLVTRKSRGDIPDEIARLDAPLPRSPAP